MTTYNQVVERNLEKLKMFVPIVDRVHGRSHPEFHQVRELFDVIAGKISVADKEIPDLADEFKRLRVVTDNYKVPGDVCESYEAVYTMLEELDAAYEG